ncbi:glycoside hydrolase superfamily [Protomyces lactucae-debilis]|uniref:glucan 1,3-beta-glucosidase n=1 Tax=Protomyces lactucae-debilis TaxID=2754530 RepID=A0A1Y2EQN0_PROLT|nr:glycoside hydrolase superfamily [Protomyces lactucae-debilis]ORY73476.1 glycoside hydrolase superfamily [Protomyces lactucae-debilis]
MKTRFTLLALLSAASATYTGYNLDAQRADGQCKTPLDWAADLAAIRTFPNPTGGDLAVRVFASSDCGTLWNIAQPAMDAGIRVLAGVWASDIDNHFSREKDALNGVIQLYGCGFLAAVSVGSEDLYRQEIPASRLAEQIYDVRGMVRQYGGACASVLITHTDTWTAWVDPANTPVINAVDFLSNDAYPYYQGANIIDGGATLATAINNVRAVAGGKPVWVGETGWPTAGAINGQAVPSVDNLQSYYRQAVCPGGPLHDINYFLFGAFDHANRAEGVEQSFGLANVNRQLKISMTC